MLGRSFLWDEKEYGQAPINIGTTFQDRSGVTYSKYSVYFYSGTGVIPKDCLASPVYHGISQDSAGILMAKVDNPLNSENLYNGLHSGRSLL